MQRSGEARTAAGRNFAAVRSTRGAVKVTVRVPDDNGIGAPVQRLLQRPAFDSAH
ncbi:hypothetical protein CBM2634_B160136 [Cupriavidus taiwanensis]|uniref:Uncharacterized protein n=1 Tax=Cupriavidus taiwanensis TaxID=164546 RepID=A0A375J804_9BURK|nr:hypothetical protein CBM2634_B160136 [Cupriavidus taiwanensis]